VIDPRGKYHGTHEIKVAPFVGKAEPKPVLPEPSKREPWAAHLVRNLLTKSDRELSKKSLSEIAGKKVPQRIDREVLAWILDTATAGHPGPFQRSIASTVAILLSEANTAQEVAAWQQRKTTPRPVPTIEQLAPMFQRLRNWKPKTPTAPYAVPPADQIGQQLPTMRPVLAA
jgi:hypothetical protein